MLLHVSIILYIIDSSNDHVTNAIGGRVHFVPEMEIFPFLFTTSGIYNLLLATLYFCLFFHMYNSKKKMIRH